MKSFAEVNQLLSAYIPASGLTKEAYTLDRMKQLMDFLGNPQEQYQVIHIAGTSGKTSTCYYIAALLGATGKKVGLTVSPYIDEINERVQINLEPLPEDTFVTNFDDFMKIIDKSDIRPTYFELIVAFAYWYFARIHVDYAVIETGLGGLLDGTNVVTNPDKIAVITDIGYDHTQLLGSTLKEIAGQKAGIIHPGNEVFYLKQSDEITNVFKQAALQNHALVHEIAPQNHSPHTKDLPEFQKRNWRLAFYVYEQVSPTPLSKSQLQATTEIVIPGRMEVMTIGRKTIILDGAHNQQKMHALVSTLRDTYPNRNYAVLFGITKKPEDEASAIIKELLPIAEHITISGFEGQQDLPKRSHPTDSISAFLKQYSPQEFEVAGDAETGLRLLLKRSEEMLLVTGSIYLIARVRKVLTSGSVNKISGR